MIINTTTQKTKVFESLSVMQKAELITFINGMIHGVLSHKKQFTISDLVGGKIRDWSHTPLDYIYQLFVNKKVDDPEAEAGKEVGRIIKYTMDLDKYRIYRIVDEKQRRYPVNVYELVKIRDKPKAGCSSGSWLGS